MNTALAASQQCLQASPYLPVWAVPVLAFGLAAAALAWVLAARTSRRRQSRVGPSNAVGMFHGLHRDALTGLPNRQSFGEALSTRLSGASPVALLVLDLDGFAALNSAYGHRAGDEVLAAASDRLRQLVPDSHSLGRLGGDEFAVLVAGGAAEAEAAALHLMRAMMEPLRVGVHALECSVSVGVALSPLHGSDGDALLGAAHAAMNQAKEGRGGSWRFFDPGRRQAELARVALMEEFRAAVATGQIVPHYQPIVELATGAMTGLEVLARWAHPTRGLLQPELFIPMAEEMQLAGALTQTLMRRVIADARDWPSWLYFAFNVSPGQLRELISMVRTPPVWPEGVLDPTRLEIEVTESAMIEDIDVAREVIAVLQERGTRVVLDDFGTGFSNFFHLRELPFDRIKIDRSFVLDIAHDARAEACVRAMLALGHSLGVDMVAEGIESAETARFLTGLGCRYGQGFVYAEPVPASGVQALLRQLAARPAPSRAAARTACLVEADA